VIPPAELGELEAFRSLLSGEEQAEIGGALCTTFDATRARRSSTAPSGSASPSRRRKRRSAGSTTSSAAEALPTALR